MQRGEDQKIASFWSVELSKQRKDRLGGQVFRMPFRTAFLHRLESDKISITTLITVRQLMFTIKV
jgi:hypothetical protein